MILLIFLIYKIWILFESINVIKIYKEESFFIVTPRNIIKRIFVNDYHREIYKQLTYFQIPDRVLKLPEINKLPELSRNYC